MPCGRLRQPLLVWASTASLDHDIAMVGLRKLRRYIHSRGASERTLFTARQAALIEVAAGIDVQL